MVCRLPFVSFGENPGPLQGSLFMQHCSCSWRSLWQGRGFSEQVVQTLGHPEASVLSPPRVPHQCPSRAATPETLLCAALAPESVLCRAEIPLVISACLLCFHTDAALLAVSGEEEAFPSSPALDPCLALFLHRWFWQRSHA